MQLLQPFDDRGMGIRFKLRKCQRLHFIHETVHADPLSKRRINVHRFLSDTAALGFILDEMQCPHIVKPVCELNEENTDIIGCREQKFTQIFSGAFIFCQCFDLRKLSHAVNKPRDVGAKFGLNLFASGQRIFNRIMKHRGRNGLTVHPQIGQNARNLDGVTIIRIARRALLRTMFLHRKHVSAVDHRLIGVLVIGFHPFD